MAVKRPQRHPGVGGDLLSRGVLDALGQEPHQGRAAQCVAGALTARGLGRANHGVNLPHKVCQN